MPNVLQKLDSIRARLLDQITTLDDETFSKAPAAGEWSVAEIVNHLGLVENRVIKELELALQRPPERLGLLRRMIPTQIVASRLIKVKAPKALRPCNLGSRAETLAALHDARSKMRILYEQQGEVRLSRTVFNHLVLGKISGIAAISTVGYHELRHCKQISEVLRKLRDQSAS